MPFQFRSSPLLQLFRSRVASIGIPPGAWAVALGAILVSVGGHLVGLDHHLQQAWTAALASGLPPQMLLAATQPWSSVGWNLSIAAGVAFALWHVALEPGATKRLALMTSAAACAVLGVAALGRAFSAAQVATQWPLLALVGGFLGKLALQVMIRWRAQRRQLGQSQQEAALGHAKAAHLTQITAELRVTTNAVLALTDLIAEGTADVQKQRQLAVLRRAADSLSRTLTDVDQLALAHGKRLQLHIAELALLPLIHDQVGQVRREAENKGLQIELSVAVDTPRSVMADANRLGQVLAHMLNHSVRSTRQGQIHLELRPHSRDRRMLRFVVTDTSMSPISSKLATMTAPFSEAILDRARHGTGIGLSLAQELAGLMGGRLTIRHSAGRGSIMIFTALLPSVPPKANLAETTSPGQVTAQEPAATHRVAALHLNLAGDGTKAVLLVDDNLSTRSLIESMLDKERFRVVTCANGRDALRALSIAPYDVVLMDLHMPEMDGMTAVKCLRKLEADRRLRRTPVIALGDAPFELERQRCLNAGFDEHLSKPVRKSRLLEAVTVLAKAVPARPASARVVPAAGQRYVHRDALALLAQGGAVDVDSAVEGLGGNAGVYLDAIEQLAPALYNWPTRFRDTLARGETERARLMALDMQSILEVVRALPCAASLGRVAGALAHQAVHPDHLSRALNELEQRMQALLQSLRQAVDRLRDGRIEHTERARRHNSAL